MFIIYIYIHVSYLSIHGLYSIVKTPVCFIYLFMVILCICCICSFVCKLPCVFSGTSTWPFVARHRTQRKRWSSWQRPQPPGQQRIGGSSPILRMLGGLFPDVRVISMFGFWERAVNCMDISDVIYGRVMRSSGFLDVEPETWPRYFCKALPRLFGFFPPLQAKSGDMLECRLCIKRHQKQAITTNKYRTCVYIDPLYALLRMNQGAVQKHPSEIST